MSALTERGHAPRGSEAEAVEGYGTAPSRIAASSPRSVSAFSFLRGWWEYALALTLGCAVFVTGSGWFVVCLCACFLLACRRTRV